MEIDDKKWQQSQVSRTLKVFVGHICENLESSKNPKGIFALKSQINYIFWRWYFLQDHVLDDSSPYFLMENYAKYEHWPVGGMFRPQAMFESNNTGINSLNVTIDIDFISFNEQNDQKDVTEEYVNNFIENNLKSWYDSRKYIQLSFTSDQWYKFWQDVLQKAKIGKIDGVGSEVILEDFVKKVRIIDPKYGLVESEIDDDPHNIVKIAQWVEFWSDFCIYWLWPLSGQMSIIAPWFVDRINYQDDIDSILETGNISSSMWTSPPSNVLLTSFGQKFIKSYEL